MISCRCRPNQVAKASAALLVLLLVTGCASLRSTSSNRVAQRIAQADEAYQHLDADHVPAYNKAVESLAREIDGEIPEQLRGELSLAGVKLEREKIALPLARCHVAPRSSWPNESRSIGAPMLLDYDTTNSPLYPRDGLIIPATAVYRRVGDTPHFCLLTGKYSIELKGSSYPLKIDNVAPITTMARRGRHVAQSGFRNMLHPEAMRERPGIYLTEPYDPNKITLLLVPGLQSTPFAFVDLMKAIRLDPEVSKRVQVWTFLYATGTPVLFNALELRQQLEETVRSVDPHHRDFATRHIVVVGHSMGGLMAHTLVSSSGEKLWNALFVVPPHDLKGDKATIRRLTEALHFQRNPRVVRVIFAASPHHGSKLAESWLGHFAASLIHLPSDLQSDIVNVVSANPNAATPMAKAFHRELNISSVRTLSPRDPALQALAALPVKVPFHSIIGQHNAAPIEESSDGVVPYSSAHLDRATSELVVRSGHGVCENPDAQREVVRILRLELQYRSSVTKMMNRPLQPCSHVMLRHETESFTATEGHGNMSTWTTQSLPH
jgi:triacylglycerol esterase/lipase EstA (alpha/beta hydrolase family)